MDRNHTTLGEAQRVINSQGFLVQEKKTTNTICSAR